MASFEGASGFSNHPTTGQYGSGSSSSGSETSRNSGGDNFNILDSEEGWDLEFVPKRSEKYDCPICLAVLREPMQTECGHRFCKACIQKWLRESETRCPVDNQPLDKRQLFPDNFAKREILALNVKCPNHTKGCDHILVLKHLQSHLDSCVFSCVHCPECGTTSVKGELSSHLENQCPKRRLPCSLCNEELQADRQQEHMLHCPQVSVNCPACDAQLIRSQLTSHINSVCEKTVVKCQYQFLGCDIEVERQLMSSHEETSLPSHMSLLNRGLILLFSLLNIQPAQAWSANRPSSLGYQPAEGTSQEAGSGASSFPSYFVSPNQPVNLNMLQQLFRQMNLTDADLRSIGTPSDGSPVASVTLASMQSRNHLSVPHNTQANAQANAAARNVTQFKEDTTEVERTDSGYTASNRTGIAADISYTSLKPSSRQDQEMPTAFNDSRFLSFKSQNDLQDESLAQHDQRLMELSHQNDIQEKAIRDLKMKVKSLEGTVSELDGRCGNGVYIWKIKNYFKLRREAEKGETTAIHSSSFYSSYYGYKLCIRVNLNGVDTAKGTHLSLFIHFMQGEYDDMLDWPFNGRIILTIIDQNPICELRNHISETLMSKPNLAAFQRPVSARNHKGFGYMEFLPLSLIDGSTYVRNDTLIIKANIVPNNN